jgi:periplasmic copper chaperone A
MSIGESVPGIAAHCGMIRRATRRFNMKTSHLVLAAVIALFVACSNPEPEAENAWIREAPPGAQALAGYLQLRNGSTRERVLMKAESGDFGSVQFHRTAIQGEIARMMMESQVEVPAGGTVEFEPGGRHLMLLKPKRILASGDSVNITLTFMDGFRLPVKFEVRKP